MSTPLAEQLRPEKLSDVVGQDHLVGQNGLLTKIISQKRPLSILLWGPPGCGKTTIARLYAKAFNRTFVSFTGVMNGVAEIKKFIQESESRPLLNNQPILFIDEIHRFNKAQQDIFLPHIEKGTIILIGATTENPSFTINNALLSRLRVLTLESLTPEALEQIITRFEEGQSKIHLTDEAKKGLILMSHGDGRHLLNALENLQTLQEGEIDFDTLCSLMQKRPAAYDRHDDQHYNLISALHKSVRGSDPDASLYWLARMLEGGEDPNFLARRLVRMAVEDIGLADPEALTITLSAWQVYERLGSPEGELALAEATLYLALAPKSNATYTAFKRAQKLASDTSHQDPPKTILNAPTKLMKKFDYGKNYAYDHDTPDGFSGQNYFPEEIERPTFYKPVKRGFEREMEKRIAYFNSLRAKLNPSK
ncbi:replication-associated recombination protein A [Simkania negevensis]|uniref:Replication-associated recombination protein A n=1 Tax=Simkania negevensis (strain ATCC VR-1471 / DSM 27360 / Z) TaxID=331113 RepID=F8L7V5_SIMNZ|nr:replication-associated recombination protein A [Simkania negevensis]CCB88857.1 replication-associated recombination protein A [Simkania negevensis Z]